jgi:hypothetical protein
MLRAFGLSCDIRARGAAFHGMRSPRRRDIFASKEP